MLETVPQRGSRPCLEEGDEHLRHLMTVGKVEQTLVSPWFLLVKADNAACLDD